MTHLVIENSLGNMVVASFLFDVYAQHYYKTNEEKLKLEYGNFSELKLLYSSELTEEQRTKLCNLIGAQL